jgi:hypothetical protein
MSPPDVAATIRTTLYIPKPPSVTAAGANGPRSRLRVRD